MEHTEKCRRSDLIVSMSPSRGIPVGAPTRVYERSFHTVAFFHDVSMTRENSHKLLNGIPDRHLV